MLNMLQALPLILQKRLSERQTKLVTPVMLRLGFTLGGLGSSVCENEEELRVKSEKAFSHSSQVLVEEYLAGWKEVEYEVVRDSYDNCVTVCNMENMDPMGIHTGESIVVAPSQTLSDFEYHSLREVSIRVVRHLGVVGECNVQFALDPKSAEYRIIEINARLSRSSALASKATGYPLAYIATKLGLGYSLTEVENPITKVTKACFEPALDYLVIKIPRWNFEKFKGVERRIGSAMKSVGEIMAIGRTFEEVLQKGLRMLEIGASGAVGDHPFHFEDIEEELRFPTHERVFAIAQAFCDGMTVSQVAELTHIDPWFLHKINHIVKISQNLGEEKKSKGKDLSADAIRKAKQYGFSDAQIAWAAGSSPEEIASLRESFAIRPFVKQIDTLAAEYPAQTNYLYLTYNACEDDIEFKGEKNSVMVLGSGAYRIGSSVEFDWCAVNAMRTAKELGYSTIMVNFNPETVSTDYNECDRLYFDELTFETLSEIYKKENPVGLVVSMGGQTPNNLALACHNAGMTILGTSAENIDRAEDRHKFSSMLEKLNIDQPQWKELSSVEESKEFANEVGYPVLVRPSYVLSGAAMKVAVNDNELERFLGEALDVSAENAIVVSKFIENAREIEIDAVAREGKILASSVFEHVENVGVHSGDATLVIPPQRTYLETMRRITKTAEKIADALNINGPFNVQFIAKDNQIKVIECNVRASRSLPYVSKILKQNFAGLATKVILGAPCEAPNISPLELDYVGVKAPQFSFTRLSGADPTLGVEMASTGEVACLGHDFEEAFLKALLSVGFRLPVKSVLLSTGPLIDKVGFLESSRLLQSMDVKLYATGGTSLFLQENGVEAEELKWPLSKESPNALDFIRDGKIDLVVNIPKNFQEEEITNDYLIRRTAADFSVNLITDLQLARRFVEALYSKDNDDLKCLAWGDY